MKILLFGRLAAGLGPELDLNLPGPCAVADVRAELARLCPQCSNDLAATRARALVNDVLAPEACAVGPADEVAFLPPLSGG